MLQRGTAGRVDAQAKRFVPCAGTVIHGADTTACKAFYPWLAGGYAVARGHYDTVQMKGTVHYFLVSRKVASGLT